MKRAELIHLAENGDVDALSDELEFVRSMYRSGDLTAAEYANETATLQMLIDQASDNQEPS